MSIQAAYDDLRAHGEAMLAQFRSAVAVDEQNLLDFLAKIEEMGKHALGTEPAAAQPAGDQSTQTADPAAASVDNAAGAAS